MLVTRLPKIVLNSDISRQIGAFTCYLANYISGLQPDHEAA
jgi:hypothetical protein